MIPSHAIRLQSMLRSMTEVLIPAIDPGQQLAIDQAHIIVGNLRLLLDQADKTYQFTLAELREYCALVTALWTESGGGPLTAAARELCRSRITSAEAITALPIPTEAALTELAAGMKEAADQLVEAALADGTAEFRRAAQQLVLTHSEAYIRRERTWFRQAGFEVDAASLPSMEEVLAPAER